MKATAFWCWVFLLAALLMGLLASLQDHKSMTADEVYEQRHLSTSLCLVSESPDGFPPLYRWLLSLFLWFVPGGARLFSALCSAAGLLLVAGTARNFGHRTGLLASLIYATSACQLEYALQVRAYSLYICFGAMVVWSALGILRRNRAIDWLGLIFGSVASLWTHYFAAFFLLCIWIGLLSVCWFDRGRADKIAPLQCLLRLGLAGIGCALLLLPWIGPLRIDLDNPPPIEAINSVDLTGLAYTYLTLVQGWCVGPSQLELFEWNRTRAMIAITPWALFTGALFLVLTWSACWPGGHQSKAVAKVGSDLMQPRTSFAIWMACTLVVTPLVAALAAELMDSSYVPRYMAVLVIPLALLLGIGASGTGSQGVRLAACLLIAVNLMSFFGRNFSERYDRENYRLLVNQLLAGDKRPQLLVLSNYLGQAVDHESAGRIELLMVGLNSDEPDNWEQIRLEVAQKFDRRRAIWVVSDWMKEDDIRVPKRDKILSEIGALANAKRISGTMELFEVLAR